MLDALSPTPLSSFHSDVPLWLKSLRLHKYQHLFAELTYHEMLTMQEQYLEQKVRGCLTTTGVERTTCS